MVRYLFFNNKNKSSYIYFVFIFFFTYTLIVFLIEKIFKDLNIYKAVLDVSKVKHFTL